MFQLNRSICNHHAEVSEHIEWMSAELNILYCKLYYRPCCRIQLKKMEKQKSFTDHSQIDGLIAESYSLLQSNEAVTVHYFNVNSNFKFIQINDVSNQSHISFELIAATMKIHTKRNRDTLKTINECISLELVRLLILDTNIYGRRKVHINNKQYDLKMC